MAIRRTTVAADADLLLFWELEAQRRGISLSAVLAEALAERRDQLRAGRKPRFGLFSSGGGWSATDANEPVARPDR